MAEHAATVAEEEYLQSLFWLQEAGLEPGLEGTLAERDEARVVLAVSDARRCTLTPSVAETVSVSADPSPPPRTALPERLVLGQRYGR